MTRVRQGMTERVQQLESQIQGKLDQARERREIMEREQKEKLRNHVSFRLSRLKYFLQFTQIVCSIIRQIEDKNEIS